MFNIFKKNKQVHLVNSPLNGKLIDLSKVPDQVFAERIVGDGVAIEPQEGILVSPVEGEIKQLFPTKHAIGIKAESGLEILVHIGIDTVELDGKGFKKFVDEGQTVEVGTKLIEFNLEYIKQNATSIITPIVVTNLEEQEINVIAESEIKIEEKLFEVK